MTAATLHELVARAPREAWPENVGYQAGCRDWAVAYKTEWFIVGVDTAVLLFEASIARWLIGEIKSYPKGSRTLTIQNCGRHWHINNDTEHSGSLLEALVAAAATLHGQRDGERR